MAGREVFGAEEKEAVLEVLSRGVLFRYGFPEERGGVFKVRQFEEAFSSYAGSKYSLGVSSGSSALKVALEALDLPRGKEVITPCFTFVATIEAIEEAGFKPVLCEIDETFNLSPEDVKQKITKDTAALVPVHMMGASARINEIMEIAQERKLRVVEDACQSTGASFKGRKLGTFGDMGCFSFDYVKVMTTGEGGMVTTNNEQLYKQADFYHDHGHPHLPDTGRGDEKRARKGFNYRMNEIQGALGIVQLKKLDYIVARQRENKKKIKAEIENAGGLKFRHILDEQGDISTFLTFLLPDKAKAERFRDKMKECGVAPATLNYWHFTANIEIAGGAFPKSEEILSRSISLEIKTNMEESLIDRITESVKSTAEKIL